MPVKKKSSRGARAVVAPKSLPAPENVPLIETAPVQKIFHAEHMFALAAAFVFIFSTLLVISSQGRAQEFQAFVSATVLPLDAYSNYRLAQMNPFERWWSQLDEYHRFMFGSAAGLATITIPLGVILYAQQRKAHVQHCAPSPQSATS